MIKIVGDCNFADGYFDLGFGTGTKLSKGWNPFEGLSISSNDYWIGNFECVAAGESGNSGIKGRYFRIQPEYLRHFKHLNLYGVANNHVMQHGDKAYCEMLRVIEDLGADYVGSDSKRSYVFKHQGRTVGIIAFSQRPDNFSSHPLYWALPEYSEIKKEIDSLRDVDFKIAFVHWGIEFIDHPYIDQIQFAHYLVDCGIDFVVGMHPHVLQGIEEYKGKTIAYSLGNCLFNMAWEPTRYSVIANVDFDASQLISFQYIEINQNTYFPNVTGSIPSKYAITSLSAKIGKYMENELYFNEVSRMTSLYRKENRKKFIKNLHHLGIKESMQMIQEFVQRRFK